MKTATSVKRFPQRVIGILPHGRIAPVQRFSPRLPMAVLILSSGIISLLVAARLLAKRTVLGQFERPGSTSRKIVMTQCSGTSSPMEGRPAWWK